MPVEQGTDEWRLDRLGFVTASRVADVMAKTKNGESASRKNYMMQLLCERLTGTVTEGFTSDAMLRGIELEPLARSEYEIINGLLVSECGSIQHPEIKWFSASPDGVVGNDGLLEIKCLGTAAHVNFLLNGEIPERYKWQMLAQMECTGRKWADYLQFDDRLPKHLRCKVVRYHYDAEKAVFMLAEIKCFLAELDEIIKKLENLD